MKKYWKLGFTIFCLLMTSVNYNVGSYRMAITQAVIAGMWIDMTIDAFFGYNT